MGKGPCQVHAYEPPQAPDYSSAMRLTVPFVMIDNTADDLRHAPQGLDMLRSLRLIRRVYVNLTAIEIRH
jgi:hypothetical protein